MLGTDVGTDDPGVTGEPGGKLLACFLFSVKNDATLTFLSNGIKRWLEAQLPKYATLFPAQEACIEHAIKFLPTLERGLAAAAAARAPAPDFETAPGRGGVPPMQPPAPDF